MTKVFTIVIVLSLWMSIECYDNGKYNPKKYNVYDDGRYYRPTAEGRYVPGDEGKYTYIYVQDADGNYRYVHKEGGFGGEGGVGGVGGDGGKGGFGGNGPQGSGGPKGPSGPRGPPGPPGPINDYIGNTIYAKRYPYIHRFIKALINKYISTDYINFGDTSEGSVNHYSKVFADKEVAVKCHYLVPEGNTTEFVTRFPQKVLLTNGNKLGSYYTFKGTKNLNTVTNSLKNKLKLEYEVYVRVVDEVTR